MKRSYRLVGACFSAALIAGCGGNSGLSSSAPTSVTPQTTTAQSARADSAAQRLEPPLWRQPLTGNGYKTLHRFTGGTDGGVPIGEPLLDVKGTLYGMASSDGANGFGTVFKITTSGKETVLYSFAGGTDAASPRGGLIDVKGTLYGTTRYGGGSGCGGGGCGTVFSVSTSGTEVVLHSFGRDNDGKNPYASLIDVNGTLYGTTLHGGVACPHYSNGCGTVYKVSTSGKERVLYRFTGGSDGWNPAGSLIDVNGTLYGTTEVGGSGVGSTCTLGSSPVGCGTVFSVSTSGIERVLYSFQDSTDGAEPAGALIDVNGALYGMANFGGSGYGTVFSVSTSGALQPIYSFKGSPDGAYPTANLIDVNGVLYGTTNAGGGSTKCSSGCGTVFSVSTSGTEKLLHSFKGSPDGGYPDTNLMEAKGKLYGTTIWGGSGSCSGPSGLSGCGTVFKVTP